MSSPCAITAALKPAATVHAERIMLWPHHVPISSVISVEFFSFSHLKAREILVLSPPRNKDGNERILNVASSHPSSEQWRRQKMRERRGAGRRSGGGDRGANFSSNGSRMHRMDETCIKMANSCSNLLGGTCHVWDARGVSFISLCC